MSDGRIEVKVYAAGELVGALESFDATSTGAADMYHGAEYYWQGKSKGFSFFTAVPMGMTAAEIMGWIDYGSQAAKFTKPCNRALSMPQNGSAHGMITLSAFTAKPPIIMPLAFTNLVPLSPLESISMFGTPLPPQSKP